MSSIGVGLDIGADSVKVVEISSGRHSRLANFGRSPVPSGSLTGGVINRQSAVAEAIRGALKDGKINSRRVVAGISGQAVILRSIKVPRMPKEELRNAVLWEAEKFIPFPLEQVSMDFQIAKKDELSNELEVMVACVQKDIVLNHVETLRSAGVKPLAIDIQPLAQLRAMGFENQDLGNTLAILDIGAETADFTVFRNGLPCFTRAISPTGFQFTKAVERSLGTSFEEAEKIKTSQGDAFYNTSFGDTGSSEYKANFAILEGLKELVTELRRSFDYFGNQVGGHDIAQLVVTGGGSQLKNLGSYLRKELGINVDIYKMNEIVKCHGKIQKKIAGLQPLFSAAIGLALREVIKE